MAETAKILNPRQDRRRPGPRRPAARSPTAARRRCSQQWLEQYPGHTVVSYINCSAEVKALSDVICTSSNAVKIVKALAGQKIVFAPDRHLGAFVAKQANRPDLVLWQGTCIVHETFSERRLLELMAQHPDAEVIAHPECDEGILRHAALHRVDERPHRLRAERARSRRSSSRPRPASCTRWQQAAPGQDADPAPPEDESCSCNMCPYMQKNTLEKLYLCAARSAAAGRCAGGRARAGAAGRSSACSR